MSPGIRDALVMVAAAAVVAVSAQVTVTIPGSPVPQTAQTLAVVLTGVFLGARRAVLAMLVYVALGAVGLPVFAGGGGGLERLVGASGGYLAGFVVAAGLVGALMERGRLDGFRTALGAMLLAHGIILFLGGLRLSVMVGPGDALSSGVLPFLGSTFVKSLVASLVVVIVGTLRKEAADAG